jgi:type II secretion system protein C
MKHPLWILNLALLTLVLFAVGFILVVRKKPVTRADLQPESTNMPLKGEPVQINIAKIYEKDLFGTFHRDLPALSPGGLPPMPEAPFPKPVSIPQEPKPQFLDPLNIQLKGIIIMLNDDSGNRAIIMDNKTNKEVTYHVGQMIEDAQIIQILSNKIVLLRSNGQQEVLYLREKDAQVDPTYVTLDSWHDVVQKASDTEFYISPTQFTNRVKNLAQFIDMLDLITVYKQGHSVGCRIGNLRENSFGKEIGLQTGDIILSINGIPATDTAQRFKIYKGIIAMKPNDLITVDLSRHNQEMTLHYMLKELKPVRKGSAEPTMSAQDIREEQIRVLQQKHKFAPTLKDMREQERKNMLEKGKAPVKNVPNNKTKKQNAKVENIV